MHSQEGKLLDRADVAMLNSLGISRVHVLASPSARSCPLRSWMPARGKGEAQIFDANRPALKACAERHCSSVVDLGIAGDTEGRLELWWRRL